MPVKLLPKKLVNRLKKVSNVIDRHLGRMKNVDYRAKEPLVKKYLKDHPAETRYAGTRVRQLNVSRNFPGTELVVKRCDSGDAQSTVNAVKNLVRQHNLHFRNTSYKIIMPKAYAINSNLIAMAKTNNPTVDEICDFDKKYRTKRGKSFFKKIQQEQAKRGIKLTEEQLFDSAEKASANSGLYLSHLVFLGYIKGKFIFVPLMDIS
ncbi:MAG: hypothetical protein ABH986_01875 [archaeon]